jgi:hypothetical protein
MPTYPMMYLPSVITNLLKIAVSLFLNQLKIFPDFHPRMNNNFDFCLGSIAAIRSIFQVPAVERAAKPFPGTSLGEKLNLMELFRNLPLLDQLRIWHFSFTGGERENYIFRVPVILYERLFFWALF